MTHEKIIAIFTGGGIFSDLILKAIIPFIYHAGYGVVVFDTARHSSESRHQFYLHRFSFFEHTILRDVIHPILDAGSIDDRAFSPAAWQKAYGYDHHMNVDVNALSFVQQIIDDGRIIGGLSIRNFQLFKKPLIDAFRTKGFFWNAHPGLLPDYRGVYSSFRAIVSGDHRCSWSLHEIDEGIDTGDMISSFSCGADIGTDFFLNFANSCSGISFLIQNALNDYLKRGHVPSYKLKKLKNSYFSYPTDRECAEWAQNGYHLIRSPIAILNSYQNYMGHIEDTLKRQALEKMVAAIRAEFETAIPRDVAAVKERVA